MDKTAQLKSPPAAEAVRKTILDAAVSWPWTSDDKRIADLGVTGDAQAASAEFGQRILDQIAEKAGSVLKQLSEHQRVIHR